MWRWSYVFRRSKRETRVITDVAHVGTCGLEVTSEGSGSGLVSFHFSKLPFVSTQFWLVVLMLYSYSHHPRLILARSLTVRLLYTYCTPTKTGLQ